ncbi:ArnT family glycosyltransferase [Candidatus Poribacteria bacterium]
MIFSDKTGLVPIGSSKDNIGLTLIDAALYQTIILCLAALIAPFLPGFVRKAARSVLSVGPITFLIAISAFVFIAASLISFLVLEHFPRDVDNVARVFQARTFASGRLYVESPPVPEAFKVANVVTKDGKMYSKYAPGSSLVYALWRRILGIQWGINPFLGAAMLGILYWVFKIWYNEQTARLALILLCLSPFFLFMTSSFHSHLPCLFFLTVFLLFLSLGHGNGKWYHFLLSGLCLGMALITRPYTALLVSLPFLARYFVLRRFREVARRLLLFAIGFAVPLGFLLYYNNALTGHPLRFPFLVANPQEKIGFGHMEHTPLKGLKNTAEMLQLLKLNLFGWPCGFSFLALFIVLGRKHRWDVVILASILCLITGYGFYHWIDFSFGPRFYFEVLPFLILLSARGMIRFPEYIRRIGFGRTSREQLENFVYSFVLVSFLLAFIFYIPPLTRMYHQDYNEIVNTRVASFARENRITRGLVFMKNIAGYNVYASGFLANMLDFQGDIVYAQDRGEEQNRAVISAYPGRNVFLFEFDRIKRTGRFTDYSEISTSSPP